jgi:aldose 1-epimerase
MPDGTGIELFTLANGAGAAVTIATYGGIVQRLLAPDRVGNPADVVLGFATLEEYLAGNDGAFFGTLVGRYANRIADGTFALDGVVHRLERNEGRHSLHGGPAGFGTRVWEVDGVVATRDEAAVRLRYQSPDGEMGYPGALSVAATYRLRAGCTLRLDLRATTDRETVVNLTSHTYWNLAGEGAGTIDGHELAVHADRYVAVDGELIPTGELPPVAGTPLDLREPAGLGSRLRGAAGPLAAAGGLDFTYVLRRSVPGSLVRAADVHEPASGRALAVFTTEPGLHVYSGRDLEGAGLGKSGLPHRARGGLSLEAQHFPDSPNHPEFPSTVLLPGETFASTTVWSLSTR